MTTGLCKHRQSNLRSSSLAVNAESGCWFNKNLATNDSVLRRRVGNSFLGNHFWPIFIEQADAAKRWTKQRGTQGEREWERVCMWKRTSTADESEEADSDVIHHQPLPRSLLPVPLPTLLFLDIQIRACFPTKCNNMTQHIVHFIYSSVNEQRCLAHPEKHNNVHNKNITMYNVLCSHILFMLLMCGHKQYQGLPTKTWANNQPWKSHKNIWLATARHGKGIITFRM